MFWVGGEVKGGGHGVVKARGGDKKNIRVISYSYNRFGGRFGLMIPCGLHESIPICRRLYYSKGPSSHAKVWGRDNEPQP